jgi:glutathione-regulated potassium-efflux system protein KefB
MAAEAVAHAADGLGLVHVVALLAAGVVAVPLFRRLGLGSVLGYLTAGVLIGPWGPMPLIAEPETILHAAELGVVMFLFVVGLEMEPSKLWSLRKQIFGLGAIQVIVCGLLLTGVGVLLGFAPAVAFVSGMGFVLTSTAIVMQILQERGELASPGGQKMVSILLLEDLAIVPLLAIVALLAPSDGEVAGGFLSRIVPIATAIGAILLLIVIGRRLLNPIFRFLADSRAREVMTAAALLVVLGAALLFQTSGLSMAMGAFLAGVLLSTSTFRHQLEADVEPFRGILLGLFFLAVGMSLDLTVVLSSWQIITLSVVFYVLVKAVAIYAIARLLKSDHREALERAVLMAQGGEFAFVLYTTAATSGLIDAPTNAIFTATVIISMVLTPFSTVIMTRLLPKPKPSMEGVEQLPGDGLRGDVLVVGFGRFGQIASQPLLAKGHAISIIDNDTEMIQAAGQFGFKIYYGDGTRLDILRVAGAATADLVIVAVDKKENANRVVELVKAEFPLVKVMSRAFDRAHAIELVKLGADYQLREVFESALAFGAEALQMLGTPAEEAAELVRDVRARDQQRFEAQILGGLQAGRDLLLSNAEEQARESGAVVQPSEPIIAPPPEAAKV